MSVKLGTKLASVATTTGAAAALLLGGATGATASPSTPTTHATTPVTWSTTAPAAIGDGVVPEAETVQDTDAAAVVSVRARVSDGVVGVLTPHRAVVIYLNDTYAGTGYWNQDPGGDLNGDGRTDPGDALIAYDGAADGWGVEARLSTGRIATTRGHNSPYWSPWATGDLPEDRTYTMQMCLVRGTSVHCGTSVLVTS